MDQLLAHFLFLGERVFITGIRVRVMTIVALIIVLVAAAYQGWSYPVFRRRIKADSEKFVY